MQLPRRSIGELAGAVPRVDLTALVEQSTPTASLITERKGRRLGADKGQDIRRRTSRPEAHRRLNSDLHVIAKLLGEVPGSPHVTLGLIRTL